MAVYFKFKSAKDYDSMPIDGHFISVANLKERIFETKHLGRGTDFDLVVTNAQTNEEYLDEVMLIPKNTSVLIRRIPGRPRIPIVTQQDEPKVENPAKDVQLTKSSFTADDSSILKDIETSEWDDEFGHDLYATIPEVTPIQSGNLIQDVPPSQADEDSKITALIETPALDWQREAADGFGPGRFFGRGGRMMGGRGFGRIGLESKTPPQGYVCHRCKVPGHFIQHCPTNGDPNYDIKKVRPPTGIPKSMLMATPDGSYALPSGVVAVLRPNEAAFEKEIEGMPSTRSVGELPPELHCPLCKEVMKDAVLTSKCCFKSFCDKCIRDYIISKSMCICRARDVLADDLLPNKTLRETINRILETNSSAENAGSIQIQDLESTRSQHRTPSPTQSAASKGEQMPPPCIEETVKPMTSASQERPVGTLQQQLLQKTSEKGKIDKVPVVSEATCGSASMKEPTKAEEEVQQKLAAVDAGKKKNKKKARMPINAAEMQWRTPQDFAMENYMMPMGSTAYDPRWMGMQPRVDAFMAPFAVPLPYNMGYGVGLMDVPFAGSLPPDPFGAHGFMFPIVHPQRDLAELNVGFNARPPVMTSEEFEARKADLRWKPETERQHGSREVSKNRDHGREVSCISGGDVASMKPKSKSAHEAPGEVRRGRDRDRSRDDRHNHLRRRTESEHDADLPPAPRKRKSEDNHYRGEEYDDDRRDVDRDRKRERERDRDGERDRRHHQRPDSRAKTPSTASEIQAPLSGSTSAVATKTASAAAASEDRRHKASVFSRTSFPAEDLKKRKLSSSSPVEPKVTVKDHETARGSSSGHRSLPSGTANGYPEGYSKTKSGLDYDSSDDDKHFKRKPSRYEPSPPRKE
ncbi:hypothetical protein Nepgr_030754 [Nepenthes gracilis]|uniref:DWNN domain-containing protein n=1 Tax=Nepenthes gracilis TaxID=150966 RepID=A0AAD3TH76_NEPGR|nr:hypothetical protein Nepgr_030754 [Nepenthes gracilis]